MPVSTKQAQNAVRHLKRSDPELRRMIERVGPFQIRLERNRFRSLVRSIISQQLSTIAARSIRQRVEAYLASQPFTAENFQRLSSERLRSAGVSPQKIGYLSDLTNSVITERVRLRTIGHKNDEAVISELVQIKGIGRWTAQMFLIFSLGRLDVVPHDDLGVRSAMRNIYGFESLPNKDEIDTIAERWRPYASVASWYCWRAIDLKL